MIEPIIFYGIKVGWDIVLQYLSFIVMLVAFLLQNRYYKFFKVDRQVMLILLFLTLVGKLTRPIWLAIENHLSGARVIINLNDFFYALSEVGTVERWYFAVLALSVFLLIYSLDRTAKYNNVMRMFDFLMVDISLGLVIAKLGCFLSGHGCYGKITTLPIGCHFAKGDFPSLFKVHPTPLYDAIFHFIIVFFSFFRNKYLNGFKALIVLICISIYNIIVENVRVKTILFLNLSIVQFVYILILLICIFAIMNLHKNEHRYSE